MRVTFITGNQGKADFLAKHVGGHIAHRKIDLDEIQSLDLRQITEHKVRQAFEIIGGPVLVEDVSFVIESMKGLPGPYIKWFEKALGLDGICRMAGSLGAEDVTISVCFCYYDGERMEFFVGSKKGRIAVEPIGENGFGFDSIFIPAGHKKTFAQMTDKELEKYSLRTTTVYPQIKEFVEKYHD